MFRDAVISILATVAKQERVRLSERTVAGLERAKAKGRVGGRPRVDYDRERVMALRPGRQVAGEHRWRTGAGENYRQQDRGQRNGAPAITARNFGTQGRRITSLFETQAADHDVAVLDTLQAKWQPRTMRKEGSSPRMLGHR